MERAKVESAKLPNCTMGGEHEVPLTYELIGTLLNGAHQMLNATCDQNVQCKAAYSQVVGCGGLLGFCLAIGIMGVILNV